MMKDRLNWQISVLEGKLNFRILLHIKLLLYGIELLNFCLDVEIILEKLTYGLLDVLFVNFLLEKYFLKVINILFRVNLICFDGKNL